MKMKMDDMVWGLKQGDWKAMAMFCWGLGIGALYIAYVQSPDRAIDVAIACGVAGLICIVIPASAKGAEEAAKEIRGVI